MRHRYLIVGMMALASFWLYIDRVCFSTLAKPMTGELLLSLAPEPDADATPTPAEIAAAKRLRQPSAAGVEDLTAEETRAALKRRWADRRMSYALGAFFLTYALFQIPMGSLADRHGARLVLALSIAAWSLVTMATGFVVGFLPLLAIRLLLGITEAGAYPAAAGLLKAWVPQQQRGRCSSVVTLGGRLGGAIAPRLTATLAAALAGVAVVEGIVPRLASTAVPAGPNWRGVFFIYGLCGLAVALLFWMLVRDRPPVPLATEPGGTAAPQRPLSGQMALLATSRNMWLAGALQFGVNLGWAFIVTLLPTYLAEVFDTPLEQIGTMQTVTLAIGCVGMLFGGAFTDLMRSRLGPRFGRSVPVGIALAGCTASFLLVPALPNAWLVILALGAMAFCVDMLVPPLWSFIQDVGGRNVGAALGWGNMWGNLGAALSPVLLTEIRQAAGWNAAFLCCGAACGLGALCGFMLDATRPVDPEPAVPPAVRRTGLTLIELLVVIAVIASLVGLLLPTLQATREGGRRAACSNNLRQLGLAFHAHHDAVGTLPYTRLDRHETWAVVIMPFCEQSAAHGLWDLSRPYYEQAAAARMTVQPGLLCPTRRGGDRALSVAGDVPQALIAQGGSAAHVPGACSDYAVCTGDHAGLADYYAGYKGLPAAEAANGTFLYKAGQIGFRRITDGLAHTVLAGEKHVPNHGFGVVGDVDGTRNQDGSVYNGDYFQSCTAAAGAGLPIADGAAGSGGFGSYHPGVCPFVMGDGSVRNLVASTDVVTLARLANRHDGQAVVLDH